MTSSVIVNFSCRMPRDIALDWRQSTVEGEDFPPFRDSLAATHEDMLFVNVPSPFNVIFMLLLAIYGGYALRRRFHFVVVVVTESSSVVIRSLVFESNLLLPLFAATFSSLCFVLVAC
ncbi:hypothetical protein MPSEU_000771200 [Mayamaea pseudoterrestris]|nr:hypothetical protein MPSEU_000771200 [Mayamaea pseudoterrestris]